MKAKNINPSRLENKSFVSSIGQSLALPSSCQSWTTALILAAALSVTGATYALAFEGTYEELVRNLKKQGQPVFITTCHAPDWNDDQTKLGYPDSSHGKPRGNQGLPGTPAGNFNFKAGG